MNRGIHCFIAEIAEFTIFPFFPRFFARASLERS
jgi:hypothetical protein